LIFTSLRRPPRPSRLSIKPAKAQNKPCKLYDEKGLFLSVTPPGGRLWRFKYKHGGREKLISLGIYPDVKRRHPGSETATSSSSS
jgi:hypothetical protein